MDPKRLMGDLNKLHQEWEANGACPELRERREWVRGVLHGIKITIHLLSRHVPEKAER